MSFKRYNGECVLKAPVVTLTKRGILQFSRAAIEKFEMWRYRFVELYYNSATVRAGITFTNKLPKQGGQLLKVYEKRYADISLRSFCDYYGIDHSAEREYELGYNDAEKIIVLELHSSSASPIPVVSEKIEFTKANRKCKERGQDDIRKGTRRGAS